MKNENKRRVNNFRKKLHTPEHLTAYLSEFEIGGKPRDLDYRIVIPSRERAECMLTSLRLIPTAYVSVSDSDVDDYLEMGLTEDRLMIHPDNINTLAKKRNWIWDNTSEECIVQVDDDFKVLVCRVGVKPRRFEDPHAILRVIENSYIVAKEAGLPAFCWARSISIHQGHFTEGDPITLSPFLSNVWGQIGREYRCDEHIQTRPDVDISLQMLLKSRVFLCDERFYFDCGVIFRKSGGNQSIRTAERDKADVDYIRNKWGNEFVLLGRKNRNGSNKLRIKVQRKQK